VAVNSKHAEYSPYFRLKAVSSVIAALKMQMGSVIYIQTPVIYSKYLNAYRGEDSH
jgi:hypothetical protein